MVRQYYVPRITEISENELESIFGVVEPPVCLLGGWAVHFHVNEGFRREHGRDYIGSRDIDLGIHVDPRWKVEDFENSPVEATLASVEKLGYTKSRFGFVQNFHRETGDRISEEKATDRPLHEVFKVYVDVIPDTDELSNFRERYGFKPPAEPLLNPVFEEEVSVPLTEYTPLDIPAEVTLVPPELLAAMKIRSLPDRDKNHKRVKDVADLHALLWYTKKFDRMRDSVAQYVTGEDLERLQNAVGEELFENGAQLLQTNPEVVAESIRRLNY